MREIFVPLCRKVVFITISLILRWPIWIALKLFGSFDYLFLVYPGTEKDLDGYCPRRLAKSWLFSGKPTIGGIVKAEKGKPRGLCLVVPNTAEQLINNKELCQKIIDRLKWIRELVGARSIAIAGQMPSAIVRHKITFDKPFVHGHKGTVFCIMETVSQVAKLHKLIAGEFKIAVIGVGYVGGLLLEAMRQEDQDVIGIDIKKSADGAILLDEEKCAILPAVDMVVVLTPKGSDFKPYLAYLKKDAVIIDDTHPRIKFHLPNILYKVAVGMNSIRFLPRLPGYQCDWIPGCAVEAIYSAATGKFNGTSQPEFNKYARELGFSAHLIPLSTPDSS